MVLSNNDMRNIVFATINEKPGEKTAITLTRKACGKIVEKAKGKGQIDTQEIMDDVIECLNYYNDFVKEKNMELPIVGDTYFTLIELTLNALIGEILNERERS